MTILQIILLIGLFGAVLMFLGDMTLYYDKADYIAEGTLKPIINIMKAKKYTRLYIGGMIGPIAAFFYCIGYYHLVLFIEEKFLLVGVCCFLVNCLGIICGGWTNPDISYMLWGSTDNNSDLIEGVPLL